LCDVWSGDALLIRSCGRTDFQGGEQFCLGPRAARDWGGVFQVITFTAERYSVTVQDLGFRVLRCAI
jgi:hypothetical protein